MNTKDNSKTSIETGAKQVVECKVYKKRWLILLLFCLYALSICVQWIIYAPISNVIEDYYQISETAGQWTSLITVVVYLIFTTPALYILDKLGIRWCSIMALVGTCIGAWMKVASVHPSRFWLLVLGQGIVGTFRAIIMPMPPKLASLWFPNNEISRASAISLLGINLSTIFGFLIPPLLVDGTTKEEIEKGLQILAYAVAIFPTILLPPVFLFFSKEPPSPPSIAERNVQDRSSNLNDYKQTLKKLFSNKSFVAFFIIFGVTGGMQGPTGIVLNKIVLKYHPDAKKDVGYLGVVITASGLVAIYVFGFILDKFGRYKLITITAFILNGFATVLFLSSLSWELYYIYVTAAIFGFFLMGLFPIAFTIAGELTYPEPIGTTGGLIMANAQIFILIFTPLYTYLYTEHTELVSTLVIAAILTLSTALFVFVKFDMRKQNFEKQEA